MGSYRAGCYDEVDRKAATEIAGNDTIARLFPRLARWSKVVHAEPYAEFVRTHRRFVLIDQLNGYVAKVLLRDGATVTAKNTYRNQWVFEVEQRVAGGAS